MVLLLEYLPIVLFFVFYKMADIYVATAVLMAATIFQLLGLKLVKEPLTPRHWIILGVVLVFGAVTLLLRDDWFIKIKVSIVYVGIAALLAGGLIWRKKSPLQSMLGKEIQLPEFAWRKLTYAWVVFALGMAALNLYIAEFWSQEAWVNFKVFGVLALTLIFTIFTGAYMFKHHTDKENDAEPL